MRKRIFEKESSFEMENHLKTQCDIQNNYVQNIYKPVPKQKYILCNIYALFNICPALARRKYTNIFSQYLC